VSRSHNDSNCLALGGRTLSLEEGLEIVRTWLETPFEGGRHQRRVAKILEIEKKNFKP
jgi:ribose 5-phosphate isomerase B